jgi:hypothetical protein
VISPTTIASETFVMDWVEDEDNLEEIMKTVEYCRTFVPEAK